MYLSCGKKALLALSVSIIFLIAMLTYREEHDPVSLFPLKNYDQTISHWIDPMALDYDVPLLTPAQQKTRQQEWYAHYVGRKSPWNARHMQKFFLNNFPDGMALFERQEMSGYSNKNKPRSKIGYGANFRPYSQEWLTRLETNMNLPQFVNQHYDAAKRAIAVDNVYGRYLPTDEVHFYHYKLAGEGYPFDNLQTAMVWAGTPLYILGETRDQEWSLVLTPHFITWVKSTRIATVNKKFVEVWRKNAKQGMVAVARTKVPIQDVESDLYRFTGYIGMAFPGAAENNQFRILIPISNDKRQANIHMALLTEQDAVSMPLLPTPRNFITIMNQLIGRPYGWGNMYFYNDCSAELKNLYTPFSIWLPAHSSDQVDPTQYSVKVADLSKKSLDERLDSLVKHGHKFMTIVYVDKHVFLYLGNYVNPVDPAKTVVPLSYQNVWGLKPKYVLARMDRRAIIGESVILPILKIYPEDPSLTSPADRAYFMMGYLDAVK